MFSWLYIEFVIVVVLIVLCACDHRLIFFIQEGADSKDVCLTSLVSLVASPGFHLTQSTQLLSAAKPCTSLLTASRLQQLLGSQHCLHSVSGQ